MQRPRNSCTLSYFMEAILSNKWGTWIDCDKYLDLKSKLRFTGARERLKAICQFERNRIRNSAVIITCFAKIDYPFIAFLERLEDFYVTLAIFWIKGGTRNLIFWMEILNFFILFNGGISDPLSFLQFFINDFSIKWSEIWETEMFSYYRVHDEFDAKMS